ncbi:hypothetical protein RclHR1_00800010 [Rhizophagus clarus]|uniref:UBP-type domain-containing protein n=1 Tax=Rhizophagus clarus TaxID=94130 RepID=A0A2Z6S618_9GLOM|nr:hypothetical protein RclHR1_00800010 [Rhizophagus clarus]GES80021.1 hypothetical protein GLOIN_2v382293 [Rhizophagus clarus]
MKPPNYDGTIHPDEWIKQIRLFCQLKKITTNREILGICKLLINSNINISQDNIYTIDNLIKVLKENPFHAMFKNTAKRKLQYMKYVEEKDGGDIVRFTRDFCSLCYDAEINEEINEVKKYWKETLSNNKLLQKEFSNKIENIESMDELVEKFDEVISERNQIINHNSIEAEEFPSIFLGSTKNGRCNHAKTSINIEKFKSKILSLICSDVKCVACVNNRTKELSKQAIWLCLACCKPHCSRNDERHGVQHSEENENHHISLDLKNFNVWCYKCERYVFISSDENQGISQVQAIIQKYQRDAKMEKQDMENNCKHVEESVNTRKLEKKMPSLLDLDIKCVTCVNNNARKLTEQTIWLCLACCKPHCSRFDERHGIQHYEENVNHNISLDLKTLKAWCYKCERYVAPSLDKNQGISKAQAIIRSYFRRDVRMMEEDTENSSTLDFYNPRCKHVEVSVNIKKLKKKLPDLTFLNIKCITCVNNSTRELSRQAIWLCLACCKPHCSRFDERHGIQHYEENVNHNISLDLKTLKAWCYKCERYVVPSLNKNQGIAKAQAIIKGYLRKDTEIEEDDMENNLSFNF